jgi:1,4-alpha-glucan branching enzyme
MNSYTDYRVGVEIPGEYQVVLNTDSKAFHGQDRISQDGKYFTTDFSWNNRANFLQGVFA